MKQRCSWSESDPLYLQYHDKEWGTPLHDDKKLLELLILEGMQAGLSWLTVLKKRNNFRQAFDHFDAEKIARYSQKQITQLLNNPGIIRNELKIKSAIKNARAYLKIKEEFKDFDSYIWQFTGGKPMRNAWKTLKQVPASTKQSDQMSKELKKHGFAFVGTTICYAFMQAAGMVNDHLVSCFRYKQLGSTKRMR